MHRQVPTWPNKRTTNDGTTVHVMHMIVGVIWILKSVNQIQMKIRIKMNVKETKMVKTVYHGTKEELLVNTQIGPWMEVVSTKTLRHTNMRMK